jgi:hypothetical protein
MLLAGMVPQRRSEVFTVCYRVPNKDRTDKVYFRKFDSVDQAEFYAKWLKGRGIYAFVA